jgi:very-short-patch-repair endonuclease
MSNEIEKITSTILKELDFHLKSFLSVCESPIEKVFVSNFIKRYIRYGYNLNFEYNFCNNKDFGFIGHSCKTVNDNVIVYHNSYCEKIILKHSGRDEPLPAYGFDDKKEITESFVNHVELTPQYEIGNYRVDFLLRYFFGSPQYDVKIVIECDGHDYHDRTPEQATRDKRRDRELVSMGYIVLRYTGSEINLTQHFKDFERIVDQIQIIATAKEWDKLNSDILSVILSDTLSDLNNSWDLVA